MYRIDDEYYLPDDDDMIIHKAQLVHDLYKYAYITTLPPCIKQ